MAKLAAIIKDAGFDAYAIMPAAPLTGMLPILKEAQKEGRYPAFVEKDINKRIDPAALQKSAQSIISLAVSYYTKDPGPTPPLHGVVSRYAWGLDYHRVLHTRMDLVIAALQKHFSAKECTKAVDTTFLVDRAIAIESGLGFPGANCAVYVPPFGSWVFLGAILVDVKLPVTGNGHNWAKPVECAACVKACPTNALFAPGKIDPGRCISHLTQMPGPIPLELREKLGSRLWGCDTCQQASLKNRRAQKSPHQEFQPIKGPHIPLLPLLSLTNREFKKEFGSTAMAWRGKNTLQRNACIVLGNQKNPQALPTLKEVALNHPSETVREAARWAVDKINSP
ncbi:MAG TPA: tRNA epoxyqueuosine(34) reductase QueG [Firmicutes bacterium]|nr:tRNA epoxyqueuosine(34) reductase QueG [Bacillota bacterium]